MENSISIDIRTLILVVAVSFLAVASVVLFKSLAGALRRRNAVVLDAEQEHVDPRDPQPLEARDTTLEEPELGRSPDSPSAASLAPPQTGDGHAPEASAPAEHLQDAPQAESPEPSAGSVEGQPQRPTSAAEKPASAVATEPAPPAAAAAIAVVAAEPTVAARSTDYSKAERLASLPVVRPLAESAEVESPAPAPRPVPEPPPVPVPSPEPAWQPPAITATPVMAPGAPAFESDAAQPAVPRPRANAHPVPQQALGPDSADTGAGASERVLPRSRVAQHVEMVAPVEMGFGDFRVGVKAGSRTHAQFLKYADVLFSDLKGAGGRTR